MNTKELRIGSGINVKLNSLLYLILIFVYLAPNYLYSIIPGNIYRTAMLICSAFIILWFLARNTMRKYYVTFRAFLPFAIILIFSTVINHGEIMNCIYEIIEIYTILCFAFLIYGGRFQNGLRYLVIYLFLTAVLNDLIIIILQGSIDVGTDINNQINFLGTDNYMGSVLIPSLYITLFYWSKNKTNNYKRQLLAVVVYGFAIFYVKSMTSMVAFVICVIFFILLYKDNTAFTRVINLKSIVIAALTLFIMITILSSGVISYFVEAVLGKSGTFTGRSVLWAQAIQKVIESPIWGYGYGAQAFNGIRFASMALGTYTTPHSSYLTLLLYSGVLGLSAFLNFLTASRKAINTVWGNNKNVRILLLGIVGILIYYLIEWRFDCKLLWIILGLLECETIEYRTKKKLLFNRFSI